MKSLILGKCPTKNFVISHRQVLEQSNAQINEVTGTKYSISIKEKLA